MRNATRATFTILACLALVVGGCRGTGSHSQAGSLPTELPDARADVSTAELAERLLAAGSVASFPVRDRAYAAIAYDAAASEHWELCIRAVVEVANLGLRDEVATNAALLAKRQGGLASGRKIASEIHSLRLRDAVMAALAEG